jgi:hypothetical protein
MRIYLATDETRISNRKLQAHEKQAADRRASAVESTRLFSRRAADPQHRRPKTEIRDPCRLARQVNEEAVGRKPSGLALRRRLLARTGRLAPCRFPKLGPDGSRRAAFPMSNLRSRRAIFIRPARASRTNPAAYAARLAWTGCSRDSDSRGSRAPLRVASAPRRCASRLTLGERAFSHWREPGRLRLSACCARGRRLGSPKGSPLAPIPYPLSVRPSSLAHSFPLE